MSATSSLSFPCPSLLFERVAVPGQRLTALIGGSSERCTVEFHREQGHNGARRVPAGAIQLANNL